MPASVRLSRCLLALLVLSLAGCGGEDPVPVSARTVTGVVIEVVTGSHDGVPNQVTGLVVETDAETIDILIDPGIDYGFDLHHLSEHESTGDPVRVKIEDRGGILYALRIDDA